MPQFYTVLTETGQAKMANALALGTTIDITALAVGDGGGVLPQPDSDRTTLINEVRRASINRLDTDPDNPSWLIVEQVLPPEVGGWTIREVGLFDVDGDLVGYGNYPETYKPTLAEGSGRTLTIRMVLEVSDTAAVTLKVDPSVVLATREYVDTERAAHEASRNHPAATEAAQGMLRLANNAEALAGEDLLKAMPAQRVHEAFQQFGLGGVAKELPGNTLNYDVGTIAPGLYQVNTETLDRPNVNRATVLVTRRASGGGETQLLMSDSPSPGVMFTRSRITGGWTAWVELYHSGNLDPSLYAQKSSNLSDLADAPTARDNLGLGSAATFNDSRYLRQDTSGSVAGSLALQNSLRVNSDGNRHVWFQDSTGVEHALIYHNTTSSRLQIRIKNGGAATKAELLLEDNGDIRPSVGRFAGPASGLTGLDTGAVNAAISGSGLGQVGTYAFLENDTGVQKSHGDVASGSNLIYGNNVASSTTRASGTWRVMGHSPAGTISLWVRIS